jgi:hypothetical protein
MTFKNIYEYFENDHDLLKFFDPLSCAKDNKEASLEIYSKLVDYSKEYRCKFIRMNCGYIFYAKPKWFFQRKMLVSFCLKPEYRGDKVSRMYFWNVVKEEVGNHFKCFLYNRNTRAISFLTKMGMKIKESNDLITLLYI